MGLNHRPQDYESCALTNRAIWPHKNAICITCFTSKHGETSHHTQTLISYRNTKHFFVGLYVYVHSCKNTGYIMCILFLLHPLFKNTKAHSSRQLRPTIPNNTGSFCIATTTTTEELSELLLQEMSL